MLPDPDSILPPGRPVVTEKFGRLIEFPANRAPRETFAMPLIPRRSAFLPMLALMLLSLTLSSAIAQRPGGRGGAGGGGGFGFGGSSLGLLQRESNAEE